MPFFLQSMYTISKKKTYHITKAGKKYLVFLKYLPFPPPSSRETTLILLLMSFLSIISHHFLVPKTSLSLSISFLKNFQMTNFLLLRKMKTYTIIVSRGLTCKVKVFFFYKKNIDFSLPYNHTFFQF